MRLLVHAVRNGEENNAKWVGRLSPFLLPYVAVSRPCLACRNLAQQGLKKVVKTSVINGDLLNGGAIQNTTVHVVWARWV